MRAHFRAFFDHAYVDIVAVLRGQLFKTNRSRKTRRSRTDNDYVCTPSLRDPSPWFLVHSRCVILYLTLSPGAVCECVGDQARATNAAAHR